MDEIVFVGTGVSTGIPVIGHLNQDCACTLAMSSPKNPNRRNNVSLLIRRYHKANPSGSTSPSSPLPPKPELHATGAGKKKDVQQEGDGEREDSSVLGELADHDKEGYHNILIDAGKTFRDAYFATMAPLGVQTLTALLLTHDHADAIGGLDDIRDLQAFRCVGETFKCLYFTPCFLSTATMKTLDKQLSYVTANSIRTGNHAARKARSEEALAADIEQREKFLNRRVACMDFIELSDVEVEPVDVPGLEGIPFYSIPLFHGGKYRSLGFAFGRGVEPSTATESGTDKPADDGPCVAYLSDISEFPTDSLAFLKRRKIDVLVLDCLLGPFQTHFSHFCLDQFWDAIVELQPVTAYGVGMFCELEHELTNQMLEARLKDYKAKFPTSRIQSVQLAYDGLTLKMNL